MAKRATVQNIVSAYMNSILTQPHSVSSIFRFMETNGWKEKDFYAHFSSFEQLEKHIFLLFFSNAHSLLLKEKTYHTYTAKNQLLSMYFTLFEQFTANRSFLLALFSNRIDLIKKSTVTSEFKSAFLKYIHELEIETLHLPFPLAQKIKHRSLMELAWGQFLMIFGFWMTDTSSNFEKTDMFIEKSIQASFDLIQTPPLESTIDLGKFMIKETLGYNGSFR